MPDDSIEQFCSYFKEQLQGVSSLSIDAPVTQPTNINIPMYQKILLVSIIDTLGRARFPDVHQNKERFILLIKECSDWQDSRRISLPQLSLSLQSIESTDGRLADDVRKRLGSWESGRIHRISEVDPLIDEIIGLANSESEHKFITDAEHASLLYTYRNHLVHEFRQPGYGMEISDDDTSPYYHGMFDSKNDHSWELVYPRSFFLNIVRSVLSSLKRHLIENKLDPYSFYKFGTIWSRR